MTNIFKIKQSLEELKTNPALTLRQQQFINGLLEENPRAMGWRAFEDIAKRPDFDNRIGRVAAAIKLELQKTSLWNTRKRAQLRLMQQEMGSAHSPEIKLTRIQEMLTSSQETKAFDLIKQEFPNHPHPSRIQQLFNDIPLHDEIDHLINAIDDELRQSFSDKNYSTILQDIRSKFVDLHQNQIEKWVNIQNSQTRSKNVDWLYEQTANYGTVMLAAREFFDPRSDGNECLGYAVKWGSEILKNQTFLGLHVSETPELKFMSYQSNFAKRFPEYNHLVPLTEQITNCQRDGEVKNETITRLNFCATFFLSTEYLVKELIKLSTEHPDSIVLLLLFGYEYSHCVGFGKIGQFYHFFDANVGWMRFNKIEDFKKWFPVYFKTKFMVGSFLKDTGYYDLYHEASFMFLDKLSDQDTEESRYSIIIQKMSQSNLFLMIVMVLYYKLKAKVPVIASVYGTFIRGLIYIGFSAKILFEYCIQTSPDNQKMTPALSKYSVDDIGVAREQPFELGLNDYDEDNTDAFSQDDVELLEPDARRDFLNEISAWKYQKQGLSFFEEKNDSVVLNKSDENPIIASDGESQLTVNI